MSKVLRIVCLVTMSLVLAVSPSWGQEPEKKKKKNAAARKTPALVNQLLKQLAPAELTEEQVTKVTAMATERHAEIMALQRKATSPEQKQARAAAVKAARAEGKTPKEVRQAGQAAAKLSEDQLAAQKQAQQARAQLKKEAIGLLSDEQREKLGAKAGNKAAAAKKRANAEKKAANAEKRKAAAE